MINHYNSLTVGELETIAYQTGNELALAVDLKHRALEEELSEEITALKEELRELRIEPILEQIRDFCLTMSNYHESEDHLWDSFYDSQSILDTVAYEGTFKARLTEALGDDLSHAEYEHILEGIASGRVTTGIKRGYMSMSPSLGCIGVCSRVMGEEGEEIPEVLSNLIEENSITKEEINKNIDEYYSQGYLYFDYSCHVAFIEASIEDIETLLEDYRGDTEWLAGKNEM